MKAILLFIVQNLLDIHSGNFLLKIKATALLAFPLGTFTWCFSEIIHWSVSNRGFMAGVLTCIAIDHIIGSFYHAFKLRDFCFRKNIAGLLYKLGLCASSVILFEIIHTTLKDVNWAYEYLKTITRLIVILYPAGSAFMNMSALTNGVFPPLGWIKKIKNFNDELDLEKFSKPNGQPDN